MSIESNILGIAWMLLFCLTGVFADGVARYIIIAGFPFSQIVFIRCFIGSVLLFPFVLRDNSFYVSRQNFIIYLVRGVFAFISLSLWFFVLKYTEFTTLIAVGFTSPLFASLLAIILLKEPFSKLKIVALLIGFSGAMVVIKPFDSEFNLYFLLALVSSFAWSVYLIFTKKLSMNQNAVTAAFFFSFILVPFFSVIAIPVWQKPDFMEWMVIIIFTLLSTIAQIALFKAFSYAKVTTLMPFEYSSLIFAAIFSYFIFDDLITINTLLGGMIIMSGNYIILLLQRRKKVKIYSANIY